MKVKLYAMDLNEMSKEDDKKFSRIIQPVHGSKCLEINIPRAIVKSLELKAKQPVILSVNKNLPDGKRVLIVEPA